MWLNNLLLSEHQHSLHSYHQKNYSFIYSPLALNHSQALQAWPPGSDHCIGWWEETRDNTNVRQSIWTGSQRPPLSSLRRGGQSSPQRRTGMGLQRPQSGYPTINSDWELISFIWLHALWGHFPIWKIVNPVVVRLQPPVQVDAAPSFIPCKPGKAFPLPPYWWSPLLLSKEVDSVTSSWTGVLVHRGWGWGSRPAWGFFVWAVNFMDESVLADYSR